MIQDKFWKWIQQNWWHNISLESLTCLFSLHALLKLIPLDDTLFHMLPKRRGRLFHVPSLSQYSSSDGTLTKTFYLVFTERQLDKDDVLLSFYMSLTEWYIHKKWIYSNVLSTKQITLAKITHSPDSISIFYKMYTKLTKLLRNERILTYWMFETTSFNT